MGEGRSLGYNEPFCLSSLDYMMEDYYCQTSYGEIRNYTN